nr:MAG TPA: hypothetical protein [Caudoviricetes sp.]
MRSHRSSATCSTGWKESTAPNTGPGYWPAHHPPRPGITKENLSLAG